MKFTKEVFDKAKNLQTEIFQNVQAAKKAAKDLTITLLTACPDNEVILDETNNVWGRNWDGESVAATSLRLNNGEVLYNGTIVDEDDSFIDGKVGDINDLCIFDWEDVLDAVMEHIENNLIEGE